MTVYAVYYASDEAQERAFDQALGERFGDTYRVSEDFWLIDTAREADTIYGSLRTTIHRSDRLFIAEITRDFFPWLSERALNWLFSPHRSWKGPLAVRQLIDHACAPD
ncbi:hypothetical protein [Amorphus orientalis]|uniref:SinR family protein n=1 Tax=Amorphus orientalis TaxID=649198 RepID=A0AAE3VSP6_9HYPH|nr:hypothetical protein [Amorphus orientalis]MDQ0317480.1 hypothetical protein [Amorphus orientalis]